MEWKQPHELPVPTEPKSSFLETILSAFPPLPLPDNFRFLLLPGPAAFPEGPESAFSKSSNGFEDCVEGGLGSFEG